MTTLALAALTAGMFLPWVESGSRRRHAFATAGVADSLDLVSSPWDTPLFIAWHAVPLLAAICVLQVATGRPSAALSGGAAAIIAGAGAMIVRTSPVASGLGVPITIGAAVVTLIAVGDWWRTNRRLSPQERWGTNR